MVHKIYLYSFLSAFIVYANCFSGPPFLTDDPQPVDLYHFEFYLSSQNAFVSHAGGGTLPHFEMNYGVISNMQLHVVVPMGYYYESHKFHYGISDVEIGIKYRFVDEGESKPQIGVFPLIEIPTGNADRGLGNGKLQAYIPLWFQKSWGDWTSYGGAGYWYNPGEGNKNWMYAGWLLQKKISDQFTCGGEVYYHSSRTDESSPAIGFNIGGSIDFSEQNHIIFSAGHTFSGENSLTAYVGFLLTI